MDILISYTVSNCYLKRPGGTVVSISSASTVVRAYVDAGKEWVRLDKAEDRDDSRALEICV